MGGGIGGLLNLKQGGQNYAYLYDGKGNVSALLDSSQAVVATYTYDAFGNLMSETGSLSQPFKFSTKLYDSETGLSYFGYRFYSPAIGRWITEDPIGYEGGLNLYGYVGNNPINWVDSFGLKACYGDILYSAIGEWPPLGKEGALGFAPPNDSVAISPAVFGFAYNTKEEREASQAIIKKNIKNIRISAPGLSKYATGGTTFTIGDVGDKYIRDSKTTRFDIYRFVSDKEARKFGKRTVPTTITGLPDSWSCPPGTKEIPDSCPTKNQNKD